MESSFAGLWSTPADRYRPERKAEFLLTNAIDAADYRRPGKEIRKLGLDPDSTPHLRQNNGSSAATGRDPGLLQIWTIGQRENIALCTFRYALEQARINLGDQDQRTWLTRLSRSLHLFEAGQTLLPSEICRPEKDLPILLATNEVR